MSETVHYKGKAIQIEKGFEDCEKEAKLILENMGNSLETYYVTYIEQLCQEFYMDYFYHSKTETLYKINYTEHDLEEEIISAKETDIIGEIEFEMRYYNGGAGFEECLEEAMNKL